jgi:hypothetical protein
MIAVALVSSICSTAAARAAPFPSLTLHIDLPNASGTVNPCNDIACEGLFKSATFHHDVLPPFALLGDTLLTAQFSYNLQTSIFSVSTNGANNAVIVTAADLAELHINLIGEVGPEGLLASYQANQQIRSNGSGAVFLSPGETRLIASAEATLKDTVVVLPGDKLFPMFIRRADILVDTSWLPDEELAFSDFFGCTLDVLACRATSVAPIVYSFFSSGSLDLTYRYCTPGVDLGCPDAIPGFNSPILPPPPPPPVPEPATLLLFAAGLSTLAVIAAKVPSARSFAT